jgi:hypothetical protein
MSGYWERVIARYIDGKMTYGLVPRFMGAALNQLFDMSVFYGGNTGNVSPGTRIVYLVPFINPVNQLFNDAAVNITTIQVGQNISLAIYKDTFIFDEFVTGTDLLELVQVLGTASTTFLGLTFTGIGTFQLNQGYYYFAIECTNSVIGVSGWNAGIGSPSIHGFEPLALATKRNLVTADNTAVAFGDWLPILPVYVAGGVILPRIFLQFQGPAPGAP